MELARGGDHFVHGQVVADAGHARARGHHVGGGLLVEADDFKNDFLLAQGERALLRGEFEQFAVIFLAAVRVRFHGAHQHAEEKIVDGLRQPLRRAREVLPPEHDARDTQRPQFRRTDGERLRQDFAADENQHRQRPDGERNRAAAPHCDAETDGDHDRVGHGVAEDDGGEEFGRLLEQLRDDRAFTGGTLGELFDLPFAEREEGGLCEREKEARGGKPEHPQHDQPRREIHGGTLFARVRGAKEKIGEARSADAESACSFCLTPRAPRSRRGNDFRMMFVLACFATLAALA